MTRMFETGRKFLLGSAALALLTAPALAQTSQPSSPEEQAQTQSLNAGAQGGMVNPADQARYEEQQNQYLQQQQEYQNQRADYDMQRARYARQRAHYASQRAAYYAETTKDPEAIPAIAPPAYPDEANLNRLYVIADPVTELARAPLVDGEGHWVGRVREVQTTNGFADRIKVYLTRERRYVWLRPSMLRYDAANGVLFTRLDFRSLRSMPRASS